MSDGIKLYLPHSTRCFICGEDNDVGLKCRFYADTHNNIHLDPVIQQKYGGFLNVVHGGIQSAILDEAMGWCGLLGADVEQLFFTRELTVKFKKNVPTNIPVFVSTKLSDYKRGFAFTEGEIRDESGAVLTTATGIFVPIPPEKMAETANELLYINDGRTYHEKALRICRPRPSKK